MYKIYALLFLFISMLCSAQSIRLSGNINDTTGKQPLPNVLMMALRFSDSTLIDFSRTNKNGFFKPIKIPVDTYIVILSHPAFSDKTYLLVPSKNDTAYNFKNVMLPPKSVVLKEVEIFAYKEKSYYKGDTLIFTADSFKTAPNATVEDLLKKLPGVKVDAAGKITMQGKVIDQVLVDGDEFFGTDPTIATRNLNATSIENIQVFEKKNENTADGQAETLKVLNLKMKEDAKKGYFGKVSGASDFNKFYENEVLLDKFKGSRKVALFGLMANTPKQAFGGNDADKFGLSGEQPYSFNDETGAWSNNNSSAGGIPKTIKSGFYFNDKISKKTKINTDYTFNQSNLLAGTQTNTQFFLEDTSYTNAKNLKTNSKNQNHAFNLRITHKLDSLTEITFVPKIRYSVADNASVQNDKFISRDGELTRETTISNKSTTNATDLNVYLKLSRNFKKKDRNISITYQPVYNNRTSVAALNTDFVYYKDQLPDSNSVQRRTQNNLKVDHNATVIYTEPWTKKLKTEISYYFIYSTNSNNRKTFDFSGTDYSLFNPLLSNDFENKRLVNRTGAKLIYDVKKYRISIGSNFRNIQQQNLNVTNGQKLKLNVTSVLPLASFNYRFNQGSNLSAYYTSASQQPDLQQMQPVRDNSDPNRISIGNPNLKPTFSNNANLNYYFYKGISDRNFYAGANAANTYNQISYATSYDSLGKAITQPINVNGNYNGSLYLGGGFPIFKRFLKMYYNLNSSHSNNVSYVNSVRNISQNTSVGPGISFEKNVDKLNVTLGCDYNYNVPKSNISASSNQPYYSYNIDGNFLIRLPAKFVLAGDGRYTNNGNRAAGYNLNYVILNASLTKIFLKAENLLVSFNANDILNQNISNQRYITSNQIVDTKTQIIKRYFLFKVTYKFNNQKTKEENDPQDGN